MLEAPKHYSADLMGIAFASQLMLVSSVTDVLKVHIKILQDNVQVSCTAK